MSPDLLGMLAGSLITLSAVPKVVARIVRVWNGSASFDGTDLVRDAAQALGNAIWVTVGLMLGLKSMVVFCSISFVLLATLVGLNLWGRMSSRSGSAARGDA